MSAGGLFFTARGAFAQALTLTPEQTLGPYYPDRLPLDLDNDLLLINDNITPAVGTVSWITGRVLNASGQPIRNALVEIWQADNGGAYIHSASPITPRDANFQGYGKFQTGSDGRYLFRTVKPGLYPGRTRHVHFAVTPPGQTRFVTQLYIQGEALNSNDGILNGIRNTAQRANVEVAWSPLASSAIGELVANFDVVMNFTPAESGTTRPSIAASGGLVNGASGVSGVVPGAWVSLFGTNLAANTRAWASADFANNRLPQSLDGVSVQINNRAAAVSYISPTQINVLAPADLSVGTVQAVVTNATGASSAVNVEVQRLQPGFFTLSADHVAAVRADGAYVAPSGLINGLTTVPAKPGDQILLYGSGFGPTTPTPTDGQAFTGAFPLSNPVTIRIDSAVVEAAFAGLVSPGLYQFNVTVPQLSDGDHSITATVGGVRTQSIVKLRTQRATVAGLMGTKPRRSAAQQKKFWRLVNRTEGA